MNKRKNWVFSSVLAVVFVLTAAFASLAGTISSVTVRVSSGIQPGDTLPDITIDNGDNSSASEGDVVVSVSTDRYYISDAKWITSESKTMEVGYEPELRVWLTPGDTGANDELYFKGSYRSSNVTIKGGSFISASKSGDDLIVKIKVKPVEGSFGAPADAYWKDNARGTAKWTKPDDSGTGSYEVVLRRGSSQVHRVETTGTSYNFYPYMTSAGTYTFRVRTIGKTSKEQKYGDKSEWTESDELYIAKEDVSDGSGRTDANNPSYTGPNGNTRVGWQYIDGYWYYYYPDGSYQKNGWAAVNGKWYLFQNDGRMLTGWQNVNGYYYCLADSGEMLTGWIASGGRWYYLNPTQDNNIGIMLQNHWVVLDGKAYYLTGDGSMAEGWYAVDGNWYYFYPGSGHRAADTWIDTFYVDANGVWRR